MAGCRRVGAVTFAVLLSFLIGQIDAQGDFPGLGSLPNELGIGASPVDLVFIVDTSQFTNTSESLDEEIAVKAFLTSFLDSADIDSGMVKVGFVTYSTHPNVVFDLDTYSSFNEMVDAIFTADFNPGERNTADALGRVRSEVLVRDRKDAPNVVLLLQTGKSDRNDYRTVQEAEALKYGRANIFVVGYNLDAEAEEEVNDIASKPTRENTFIMGSAFELDLVKEIVFAQIFTRAEQSRNSPAAASETLDVAFLIHFSNTLKRDDYQRIIEFMKSTVQYSAIDDDNVRVGAVVFRKRGVLLFDFNSYYTKDEVLSGIDQINYNYRAKSASIAAGFDTVRSSVFVNSAGERRDVPNLVVFITDANADTDMSETIQSAEKLKAAGTAIYTVGINVTYPDELLGLASSPDYTLIVNDTQYLEQQVFRLRDAFVALRTEEMPLEVPGSTTEFYETTTTASTTTTVHNSESADIVFLIHVSKKTKSKLFKKFMLKYIIGLAMRPDHTKTKFAVVTYGMQAETIFNLQLFKQKKLIKTAIKKVPKDKRYKTADLTEALRYVRDSVLTADNGDEANNPNGIILFSDQASTKFNGDELKTVADSLKGDGIGLFAIGIGTDRTLQTEIETVTGDTKATDSFMVNDYSELLESRELTKKIASSFKPFYLEELDVVLALHVSHNVKIKDVKKQLYPFLNDLISSVDIESGAVRVSVVVYGLDAKVQFDFDKYSKSKKLVKAIKKITKANSVRTKGSDIVKLLNVVQTDVLVEKKGDRSDVPNLLILFTDSTSSSQITDIIQESAAMKRAGTTMFAIGVKDADITEIETVASDPAGEYSFIGKSYGEFSTSINLREKLKSIKIFENMKMPKSGKTTDKNKPKPTKPPKASTLNPRPTNKPRTVTIVQHTRPQPTTTKRSRQLTTLPPIKPKPKTTDWANTMSTVAPTTTYLRRVVFEGEANTQMTKVATPTTTSPITEYTVSPPVIPTLPLAESNTADIVLAVHLSPRASPFDFGAVQQFLKSLIADADVVNNSVQIGLMFYAADPEVIFHINQYHDLSLMMKAIDGLNVDLRSFRTDASGALALGRQMLSTYFNRRNDVPSALIFITDEPTNENIDLLVESKDAAVFEGIEIFAIGVGMHDKVEVEALATSPDNVMMVQRYGQLSDAAEALQDKISAFGKQKEIVEEKVEMGPTTTAETPAGPMATVPVRTEEPALYITLAPFLSDNTRSCGSSQFDLVIILDASTSVQQENWNKILLSTQRLVQEIDIDGDKVRIGVIVFGNDAEVKFHLNSYNNKPDILRAISRIQYSYGRTNTADALKLMRTEMFRQRNGDRSDIPNVAIVITDGVSNINNESTIPEANLARRRGIQIFAIGIGLSATAELDGIAGSRENRYLIDNFDALDEKMESIYTTLCPETTTVPPTTLSTTIAVTTHKDPCTRTDIDLAFILDTSTSVAEDNFQLMIAAAKDFVHRADIDSGNTRLAIVTYSTVVNVEFDLNTYATKDALIAAINNIEYIRGDTNTADAIKTIRTRIFSSFYGDREGTPNVAIIVTDGVSNINHYKTIPEAKLARQAGIEIFAIGVGVSKTEELDAIAGRSQNRYDIEKFDELELKLDVVYKSLCGAGTGAPVILEPANCQLGNSDLVIIIDASTSVTEVNFKKQLQFTKDLLKNADIDSGTVRVGILIYSTDVKIQFHLNQYQSKYDINAAIDRIPYIYGSTNTADALSTMHHTMFTATNGDRPDVPNTCIVITDGISNINGRKTIPNAEAARAANIHIYAVGIGITETRELNGIATVPARDNVFSVQSFEELKGLDQKIFSTLCPVAVEPTKPPQPTCGLSTVDLVIIIDASTSVTESNFQKMREFCKDLVDYADVDSGSVRVGVLIYSTEVEIQFHLNKYKTTDDIKAAIDRIPYIYGSTNTADSLETMHEVMFTSSNGDRAGVDNVGVILTDGISNINSRRTIPEAVTARKKGIVIYAIGIGLTDTREVDGIASTPTDQYSYNVHEFDELVGLSATIFGGGDGSTDCGKPVIVTTTTAAPQPKAECGLSKVDVVIILDASTSVTKPNFLKMLTFAKDIVDKADVDSGSVRIAALIYSTEVEIQFYLNQYKTGDEIKAAIDKIPYIYGSTNSADALKAMHQTLFNQATGDRPDVDNIAFMITDGISNINGRRTIPEAEAARAKGIRVYAIGIGLDDTRELEGMASEPSEDNTFNVKEFDELGGLVDTIFGGTDSEACAPNEPPVANAGSDVSIQMPIDFVTLDGRNSTDDAEVVMYQWIQVSGSTNIVTQGEDNAVLELSRLNAGVYVFALTVFDVDGQSDDDEVQVTVKERDFPPTADAGDDVTLQAPANRVTLDGSGSTDDVEIIQYLWVLVSGDDEGSLTLDGVNKQKVNVRGLKDGTYQFELTVLDALGQSDTDTVNILVTAAEIPPVARAGDDVTIKLPTNNVTLDGSHSSDDVGVVRYRWRLRSGDKSGVVLDGEKSRILELTELKPGIYRFSLTVIDGQKLKHTDFVEVTVLPDDPPVANAGKDITVQLPIDIVSVRGDMSTDDVGIATYVWTLLSGDSSVLMDRTDEANIDLYGLTAGTYTFELLVTDASKYRDTDTMTLVVLPEPTLAPSTEAPCGLDKTDLIFVVDASTSVTEKNFKKQLEFMKSVIRFADVNSGSVRFGALIYSTEVEIQFHLNDYSTEDDIIAAVDRIPYIYGSTNTADGLAMMRDTMFSYRYGDRDDAPNVAMVITDGVSNINGRKTIPQAEESRDVGIHIFAVGIGLTDTRELNAIASDPFTENAFAVADFDELSGLGPKIFSATCIEVTTTTTTTTTTTMTTTTTAPPTTSPSCGLSKTDLVFILDASTSVTEKNFQKMREFLKDFLGNADIDSGSVRVGINIYSTEVQIMFHLDEYTTEAEVLAAIDEIPYIYGSTNTADALEVMTSQMFLPERGDRPDAPNVCVLLTDGISNINSRRTIPEAEDTRRAGIHVYVIGIGLKDTREVEGIATPPIAHNLFAVQDFDELVGLKQKMFSSVCPDEEEPPCGFTDADVVMLLDASTSVTQANFNKMLALTKQFVNDAAIDDGSVRIAVAIYSSDVVVQFDLDTFTIKTDIIRAIDQIPYIYGSTNTFDALKTMRTKMFRRRTGDRHGVKNYAILITDGISNINARKVLPEAEKSWLAGIHIYTIGIGLTDTTELYGIASPPASENSIAVDDFENLEGLPGRMFKGTCEEDLPPTANAGKDMTIRLPDDIILLSGEKSTDDIEIVTYVWSQVSGPRVNVIQSDNSFLELTDLKEGTYVIELQVSDWKGQVDTDTVIITVLPEPDLPPIADAGADKRIQLPKDNVVLSGIDSTDDKGIVDFYWVLTSPNDWSVKLWGENSMTLNVDNLQEGEYVFTLTVKDKKGQTDSDTALVKVIAAPDLPPIANAGRDYDIQLPTDTVTLDGSRSTDDIGIVSYQWTLISGESRRLRLYGEDSQSLTLDGLKEGEYILSLVVSDKKGQTSSDEARITVKRARRVSGWDVIFILDSSVSPSKFRWMNNYARNVIREMSIDDGEFRVGYLIYSNGAYRQFDLNAHDNKADVMAAIDKVGYRPGDKNTASAFKFARKRMFTPENGDRTYAKNYVVHLTGGDPSMNPFQAATEACQLQTNDAGMFAVGFGEVPDLTELNAYSSIPTDDYELLIRAESEMGETPGLMLYQLKRGSPSPSRCPEKATTPRPKGPFKCTSSGDIIFILDSSGSVGQDNFYRVLNFTYSTIAGLDVNNGQFRVGVTTFSDTSRLDFNLNEFSTRNEIEKALTQRVVYMYGNTHTAHALRRVRNEMFTMQAGDRPDIPNVIVIITDGQSNVNHELTIPEARALKADGVTIVTVAVGFTSETSELIGLTSPPISENLIYVADYESLDRLREQLIEPLCTDSNMCRSKPCHNGGVCMDGIRSFVCLCPDDYFGETCSKRCGDPADVVIVLDSSNTVGAYNFARLKEYAEHLVREMNKDSCDINLGFLTYSSAAMVQVHLGMHSDTETNIRAIEQISYTRGRANMAAAFRALRTEMYNGRRGDRTGARNIVYFLTDGTNDVHAEMTEPEAELTISAGIRIIPIGINLRERFELDNIAQNQGITVIEINDEPGLIENTDIILRPLYEGNDFCGESPCGNGGICVNEPFGFRCDCPVGFTGETCQRRCKAKGDVVFVVDTSRFVTRKELKNVRRFLRSIVKRMKFKRNEFSVGMVQFTDWAKVTLDFDSGKSKKAVRSSIAGLRVHGGDPEPAVALAKANFRIFNGRGASRDKPDYLILLTKSMRQEQDILSEANKLKMQGTRIIGVGLGLTKSEQEYMESTVSMPYRQTAMFTNNAKELGDISDRIVEYMCDDEDLCAENPCRNGGSCERLGGDFYCSCAVGYAGKFCENKCQARADIVFLLDSSGSVGHVDFRRVKQFVHNMVSDLQIGTDKTRVGLVTYSSHSRHGFFMSKYYTLYELQNAIAGISYEYGNSNAAEGLRLVRERYFGGTNGDRVEIQNFLVIVTDGVSNVQPDQTIIEAQLLKDQGVHVYAVGIGEFDPYEINSIASEPSRMNAYMLKDYSALDNISSSIVKATCRDPTMCDENPCRNGGLCVPGINGAFCECRAGYRGEHCQDSCVSVKDIFFLLDSSDSVGSANFESALNFITSLVEEFSGKGSYNRFSLITYSTDVQIVFSLGRYTRLPVIQNAVKYARYRPGNTNLVGAFRTANEISVHVLGDRYDAENIIFVIADGNGNVDERETVQAAQDLKDKGARIIPIAVNMNDHSEMEQIASSKTDVFQVDTFSKLQDELDDIIATTCKNSNTVHDGK